MTDILDALGLAALTVAGFLVAAPVGLVVLGLSCLAISRARQRGGR